MCSWALLLVRLLGLMDLLRSLCTAALLGTDPGPGCPLPRGAPPSSGEAVAVPALLPSRENAPSLGMLL